MKSKLSLISLAAAMQKKISFERKLFGGFIAIIILIIVVGVFSFYYSDKRISTSQLVNHTNLVLNEAEQTLSHVKDIEGIGRAFIITGDPSYISEFAISKDSTLTKVNNLKVLTKDNPVQQLQIDSLLAFINKRISFSEQFIQLKKDKEEEALSQLMATKLGKVYSDKIREITWAIQREENNLLAQRQAENIKSIGSFNTAFVVFLAAVFALLIIIYFAIRQNIRIRKRSEANLEQMNNELEQKVAERTEKLVASEKQFRHTLDSMLEGAQIIGFDWRYIYVNDSLARHGKYPKEEMIGYTVMEKYPGIEQTEIFKVYQQCFTERVSIHLENEFIFPDNSKGWFELSFQPVPEGIFILSIDITERKKVQQEIQKLNEELEQKVISRTVQVEAVNKELEAFSYSISHDLRAPLRGIVGFTEMLEEKYTSKLDDEAKRITTIIKGNSLKMGNLIDDLLAFSRMSRQEITKNSIPTNELVKEVIGEFNNGNKNIDWQIDPLPETYGDINAIRQVWINLISNARKYSSNSPAPRIEMGSYDDNGEQVFFIKDNGVGFDPKYKDKLFKVFQRLHSAKEFEGTGVGLAIVEKIISKHGGKVWAEAEKDKGASFFFSLPGK